MKKLSVLLLLVLSMVMTSHRVFADNGLPTVTTTTVTKSGNNVVSGGNVTDDGGSPVTARGICYGSNPTPDLSTTFTHTEDGTGTGVFTSVIDNSTSGTIYVRAYATNANGTAYGEELSVNIDYCRLPRFEYNGLTYVVAPDPQSTSSTEYISYSAALSYCENLTAYGYSDWVMPDIYELEMMWQNRTSIGGFIQGTTSNPMCYHSSTYYGSTGHYKLVWLTGGRVQNANLENIGCVTATSGGVTATFRCHVRPIRKEIFLPSVTTNDVTNITYTSATFGGIVTDDGGATVTERGICWGSSPNPTINDLHSNSGTGTGNYTITYGSLTPGTQYYVRAYAINCVGTSYGNEVGFTTPQIGIPTVTTNSVFDITTTTAKGGGNVISNGGTNTGITERGICWSTSHNPTTYNSHVSDYYHSWSYYNSGSYTLNMTDLIPGTQYYVRAYATNSEGTAYGDEVTFTTTAPPTVTTNNVTNITPNSAVCGGNVTAEGSGSVTARGVCWSTSPSPTTSNSHTNNGTGTGSFTSNITGLNQGTLYYVRAYATNSEGTAYGEEMYFTTTCPPIVTTNELSNITPVSAICGGFVTNNCGGTVTARGVCWSTSHNPTTSNNHTNEGMGDGSFSSNLTGLTAGTQYYVRAYAINNDGTSYGNEMSFTTTYLMVTTNDATYITQTSATCGGYVTAYNGAAVTARGVCWSTTPNPTISNSHTSDGIGAGGFTSNLTGLAQNTTYYVRAYATSSEGTVYGDAKQFTTTKLEYRISEGGVVATSAGGYFYDSGGPNGPYGNNEHYIMTFKSNQGTGTKIQMAFTQFSTNINYGEDDYLMIYDGMNTSAPLIGTYNGSNSPGTVTATNSDGALTFVFISDGVDYSHLGASGWTAAISIVTPDYLIDASANPSYGGTVSGGGYFNYGENCTLTATPAAGYTFVNWTENGNVVSSNANYSFTVNGNRNLVANFVEEGSVCSLVFDLMDSFGDGWNGAQLNVSFSDGSPSQNLTFTSGYNASYVIAANDGANVTLSWTQGSYDSECSFKVKYEDGPQIYQYSYPNSNFTYIFQMDCSSSDNPIVFADANVKAHCVANWDTNGDGELSYAEAAAVANLGEVFKNNSSITYFNELQYFTGLTSIGNYVFQSCSSLVSVSIPNSATSIGNYAFNGCSNLTSINIPISVTSIGGNAFTGCSSLTLITLPVYLTSIGNNAFYGCTSLASIAIPRYVTSLGAEVFRDCPSLAHMSVNGNNTVYDSRNNCKAIIKTATNELLYGCKNTIIPNTVSSIGGAFDGCTSLTSIEIPSSVTSIGNYAFYNCTAMNTMTILADNPPTLGSGVFTGVNKSIPVYIPCGTKDVYQNTNGWSAFTNFQQEEECLISFADANVKALCVANWDTNGDGELSYAEAAAVTSLGQVFRSNYSITSFNELQYFTGLSSIGYSAFAECTSLTSITIPNSVTSIGDYAFNMSSLTSITIPNSVSTIGENPFSSCYQMEQIFVDSGNPIYDSRGNCNAIIQTSTNVLVSGCKNTVIPNSVTSIGNAAFDGCSLASITIPNSVTSIGNSAFNHTALTHITIPNSVTSIGELAFCACPLISIEIPNSVISIGYQAFAFCTSMTSITISSSVTSIGTGVFWWCYQLEQINVDTGNPVYDSRENCNAIIETSTNTLVAGCKSTVIPNSVTSIGPGAFLHLNSLTYIEIPNSVTNIEVMAFSGCTGLTSMRVLAETPPILGDEVFSEVNKSIPVYVPCGAASAYQSVSGWNAFTNIQEIGCPSYAIDATVTPAESGFITGVGTYTPNTICTLIATANTGYTFVNWTEGGMIVSTEANYSFEVTEARSLVANFSEIMNHWTPESSGTSGSMVLIGKIQINGIDQTTDQLELGVFCGDECRGASMAHLFTYVQPNYYMVDPTVYGDAGDNFTFKLYDHSLDQELSLTSPEAVSFIEDGYGDVFEPYVLNFLSTVSHTQSLASGWNWWSTYIEQEGIDGLEMLKNSLGGSCIRIQSRNQYVDNYTSFWYGTLSEITNEQSYRIRTNAECEAILIGEATIPENHPITINGGWNWIGFPSSQSMSVTTAMNGFSPEVNDQIKSRHQYASYLGNNYWYGTLNTLEPGQGYMYKSNSNESKTLVYQTGRGVNTEANITTKNNFFTPSSENYADNMTITAVIEIDEQELRSDEYELAAFVGNECRGSVKLMYVEPIDRYVAFLLVYGETEENMSFVLTDGRKLNWSNEGVKFTANGTVGLITEPVVLNFGILGLNNNEQPFVNIFPNPSHGIFNIEGNDIRKIEIVNAFGQIVLSKEIVDDHIQVNLSDKANGIYLLRIITNNGIITNQLIKE